MALPTLVTGFIFFTSLHIICRHLLKSVSFKVLTTADIYFISEKWVNSVQAVMATVIGVIIAKNCGQNIMTDIHWLTNSYARFGLPYFFYDTWAMYNTHYYLNEKKLLKMTLMQKLSDFAKKNTAMLLHHISLPLVFFPVILFIRADKGDYFVGIFYTCEAAIPFISLRFVLVQLNMKDNPFYIISGLLMILVFFLVRVCIFPFLYWKYSTYANISFLQVPFSIPIKCNIGCLLILLFQVYFLCLMIRGACRVFIKMYKKSF